MRKIALILSLMTSLVVVQAQNARPQHPDTLPPCGQYIVTNGTTIIQSKIESQILNSLRAGSAIITSESEDPSIKPDEIDTGSVVEILAGQALAQLSNKEITQVVSIPKTVTITPQLITIAYENSDSTIQYLLKGLRSYKQDNSRWRLLREGADDIRMERVKNLYMLFIPEEKPLRLLRQ